MSTIEKETKNFVERAVIARDQQKAVSEFFVSKEEERNAIKKYPEWDRPRICPATEVVRARRKLANVHQLLQKKWIEQEKKRKMMDEHWNDMREKQIKFRQSFIKFNTFVKENEEKRERADLKIKGERDRQKERQAEIEDLTKKLNYMKSVRESMKKKVEEYKMYKIYLEKVVSETGEFQSISEIFNRYESLIEARTTLTEHQDYQLEALEKTGTEIHHMADTKSQILMGLNKKLSQLQAREEKAKVQAFKWETIVSKIKTTAAEKNLELTKVKTSCWNMYQQICKRKDVPVTVSHADIEQQLIQIKRTILELKRILKVAQKKSVKEYYWSDDK